MKPVYTAVSLLLLFFAAHSPAGAKPSVESKLRTGKARSHFYAVVLSDGAVRKAGAADRALDRLEARLIDRGATIVARFEHVFRVPARSLRDLGDGRRAAQVLRESPRFTHLRNVVNRRSWSPASVPLGSNKRSAVERCKNAT